MIHDIVILLVAAAWFACGYCVCLAVGPVCRRVEDRDHEAGA